MRKWIKLLMPRRRRPVVLPAPCHTTYHVERPFYVYNWTKMHGLRLRGTKA